MCKRTFLVILLLTVILGLFAQYPLTSDNKSPFVEVVQNIRESVVNIQVEYEVASNQGNGFPFEDDIFRFFFPDLPRDQAPRNRKSLAMGSGFIFKYEDNKAYIITNNHVVQNGIDGDITVTLADKAKYKAEIVGLDSDTDLAVIVIETDLEEEITVVPLGDSDTIDIGEWAIAIGNPFGQLGLERTVTVGVISATGRANLQFGGDSPIYQDYIQTDAAINPGNSGGPLLNLNGEVIGVNAAITSTSGGNVGIGFAIPINLAKKVSSDLISSGKVTRAYIGILPQDIDYDLRQSLSLPEVAGVLVAKVENDTPAQQAGMKKGDVIIEFNGKTIANVAKFRIAIANSPIGVNLPVLIIRDKKEKELTVKLVPRPDEMVPEPIENEGSDIGSLGLEVESLESEFARQQNISEDKGVIISRILPDSPAADSGLSVGDIILEIDQKEIEDLQDFNKIADEIQEDIVLFYIRSTDGNYQFLTINLGND
jgi:Do/DeqQ family serine protease